MTPAVTEYQDPRLAVELLGCLAVHTRLHVDILATAVGESARKVDRVLANFEEWLEDTRDGETVAIETDRKHAVLRWTLVDSTRRDTLVDILVTTEKLRKEGLHDVAVHLAEAYCLGHKHGDNEYCTAVIECANSTLGRALEAGLGLTGRFTVAESIDILARHGVPIDPTVLTANSEKLIDGYQTLADEYPALTEYTSSSFGDSKRIAGNNLGQLLAAIRATPFVEYDDTANPVSLLNEIALAGGYCRQDPAVVDFRMAVFGEAVKTLTTTYPEECTADVVHDLEEEILDGIVHSSTDLETAMLTADSISELSPAMRRAEIRAQLWTAAVSKLVSAHVDDPELCTHWTRFAFERAGVAVTGNAGTDVEPESLLQCLYVGTVRKLPLQFSSVMDWKRGIKALDTALNGIVDRHWATVDAAAIRATALEEMAAESTEYPYALMQLINGPTTDTVSNSDGWD